MDDKLLATFHAYDLEAVHDFAHLYDYISALNEIREEVRRWTKYGHQFKDADAALAGVYGMIFKVLNDRGIDE